MSDKGERGGEGGGGRGGRGETGGRDETGPAARVRVLHGKRHPQEEVLFDTRTFVQHGPVPAAPGAGAPPRLVERREAARRAFVREIRRARRLRPGAGANLPASLAYGRLADLGQVGRAAQTLEADVHTWHRMHLATLLPEGVENALAGLVAQGDRACALFAVRVAGRDLRLSGADALARMRYWLAVLSPPERSGTALRRLRAALPTAVRQGDRERTARILGQLGRLYAVRGDFDPAYTRLCAAVDLCQDVDLEPVLQAAMQINLGNVLVSLGHVAHAEAPYRRALDLALAGSAEAVAMLAREGLRYMLEQRGDLAEAYLEGSAVLAWRRRVGPETRVRAALVHLARLAHELDPTGSDALALLSEAESLAGPPQSDSVLWLGQATAYIAHGDEERAIERIRRAEALIPALPGASANLTAFHVAYLRADLLLGRGEVPGAYEHYRAAARILAAYPGHNTDIPPYLRAALVAGMTAAAEASGRTDEAVALADALARAWQPAPLPQDRTAEVVRAELDLAGASRAETGTVVFLSRAGTPRRRGEGANARHRPAP